MELVFMDTSETQSRNHILEVVIMKINLILLPVFCQGDCQEKIPEPSVLREWPLMVFLKMFICLTKFQVFFVFFQISGGKDLLHLNNCVCSL